MNPIAHLLEEHRAIMAQVADLRAAVSDLEARGEAALPETLPILARMGQMMETRLARHARKEDEALFPAIEAVLGAEGSPTSVMRTEHAEIHSQGELLRRTLSEINRVEHPQLESGMAGLKQAVAAGSARALRANADEIIRLLDAYFAREEQILFPMAQNMLDDEMLDAVGRRMEELLS